MSTPRENSVKQLSELYTVVIGIALSLGIYGVYNESPDSIPVNLGYLWNFFTFLILIVPFYHGAVRHLFATYVEKGGSTRVKEGALLIDFFLLFMEGCLFVIMAASVTKTVMFAWVIVGMLILDSIWGVLAWIASLTGAHSQNAEKVWAFLNVICAGILTVGLIFLSDQEPIKPIQFQIALFVVIGIRTLIDYVKAWNFYFPGKEEKAAVAAKK